MQVCPKCGTKVTPGQKFCTKCGTSLSGISHISSKEIYEDEIQQEIDEKIRSRKSREKMMDNYTGDDFMRQVNKAFLDKSGGSSGTLQQRYPFEHVDRENPDSKGLLLLEDMNFKEAVEYYTTLFKRLSPTAKMWNNLGVAFMAMKNRKEALYCYEKALEVKSNSYIALYNKGAVYYECKQYEKAIEFFDKALEINPKCGEAYNDRRIAREKLGNLDFGGMFEAMELGINIGRAQLNMGSSLVDLGGGKDAIVGFHKLTLKNKEELDDIHDAASVLEKHGKAHEALEKHEQALRVNPQDPFSWFQKGRLVMMLRNDVDEGIACFSNSINYDPAITNPDLVMSAFMLRAGCYFEKGDFNNSLKDLNIAELINPFSKEVAKLKGLFYKIERKPQRMTGMKKCPRCGKVSLAGNKYCYTCGFQFRDYNTY